MSGALRLYMFYLLQHVRKMIFVGILCCQAQSYSAALQDLYIMDNTLKAFEIGNDHLYSSPPVPAMVSFVLYDQSLL